MVSDEQFKVKTAVFQGPLELLLDLIEKRKLHISDISLAKVTDDYIAHIQQFEHYPMADSANFILVATTLLLIKSKSLLPSLALSEEEQHSIEDLEYRLKIYKEIRELAVYVKERFGKELIFQKSETKMFDPVFSPHESMKADNLFSAIQDVIKNFPRPEVLPKAIVKKVISLEEMIINLTQRIQTNLKMSFREFSKHGKDEKVNVIVGFLAMLELVKQGIISVTQDKHFEDIHMETENISVPKY